MSVIELGEYGADFTAHPYPYYAKFRENGPVHEVRMPDGFQFWLVVGHEEGRAALADPRLAKSPHVIGVRPPEEDIIGVHLLSADAPDHTRLRRLVTGEFTGRRVEALRPRIERLTTELVDAMEPAGRADLVDAFAYPLPITVICELLGVPSADRDTFRRWSTELVSPTGEEDFGRSMVDFGAYLDELIEDKRAAGPADDLLSGLIASRAEDGDRLSGPELRAMAYLLLIAGHETTVNLIANTVRNLLTHPDQLAALRADPGLLDGTIEESLRFDGPVETSTFRFSREPVTLGGTEIPAGRHVLVAIGALDRDPARFPEPDRFDIRRDTRGHLAFGHGIHYCLGAPLARLEGRIALRTLLDRFPGLELDPEGEPWEWLPGLLMRGVRHLPVRW
ncbi:MULTISPECIES: cytochrome P450 family protein [unclassified Streptomyces]|uniref:cytochrome P450 family protein n=1 Tax=unclassified Streptomyces TaxID=2593676 RepID=UPI00093CC126|nr:MULTISPECIES: cytochrome P450 [unclassified Streptomyces]MCD2463513.1 cytochrome P450 [Streptomyces sp. MBT42]OKJ62269.1 cytochrome [Streptomyces sp. CB02009]